MRLYILAGGLLEADRAVIHPSDDSHRRVMLPCTQVLIESGSRWVLFDTGMPPEAAGDPSGLERTRGIDPRWIQPYMAPQERVDAQLAELGLAISDLELVVNTHFHFDHAGQNGLFTEVTIAAQEAELAAAQDGGYAPGWDAPGLHYRAVRDDWSPLPNVEMLSTPGHSPGHQSMLVRIGPQPWLFTFDAVYTEEHWRANTLGAVREVATARASMDRLRDIAEREDARLIFGHDIAQWESLGMKQPGHPLLAAVDDR